MGKWVHRISNVSLLRETGTCSNCGEVPVYKKGGRWRCRPAKQAYEKANPPAPIIGSNPSSPTARRRERAKTELRPNPGYCEICLTPTDRIMIDHDHDTEVLRGWLCGLCNSGLGFFKDDVDRLARAITYLQTKRPSLDE